MKLNCDMGESFGAWQMGNDHAVMPWIDQANIACGFHASDPDVMAQTVSWAISHHVEIGAHPGYNDKVGFGRRSIPHSLASITRLVAYQAGALDAICQLHDIHISYIKPHGALYNDMMANDGIFEAIVEAVAGLNQHRTIKLKLMILAQPDNTHYQKIAERYDVELLLEAFADRAYNDTGSLVPRSNPEAVYHDATKIKQQVIELADGRVTTLSGKTLTFHADSVCVHGDNDESIATIAALHKVLNP